jgi:hypothetical protein
MLLRVRLLAQALAVMVLLAIVLLLLLIQPPSTVTALLHLARPLRRFSQGIHQQNACQSHACEGAAHCAP